MIGFRINSKNLFSFYKTFTFIIFILSSSNFKIVLLLLAGPWIMAIQLKVKPWLRCVDKAKHSK